MDSRPTLSAEEWHAWFTTQAGWTRETRRWLYRQAGLARARAVLEVGCGTGVITGELARLTDADVVGLDIDPAILRFARRSRGGEIAWVQGDAHTLPFPRATFDLVVSHYLLLWLRDPARGMGEMARVTRPGGVVLICAEPDYGGRIDHPPELVPLGQLQAESLRRQGADPEMGRRLGELFAGAGLRGTVGIMTGRWQIPTSPGDDFEAEWEMRERDLRGLLPTRELEKLRAIDRQALLSGRRLLFVPTFYGIGKRDRI